jgi:hypothetical protein
LCVERATGAASWRDVELLVLWITKIDNGVKVDLLYVRRMR